MFFDYKGLKYNTHDVKKGALGIYCFFSFTALVIDIALFIFFFSLLRYYVSNKQKRLE